VLRLEDHPHRLLACRPRNWCLLVAVGVCDHCSSRPVAPRASPFLTLSAPARETLTRTIASRHSGPMADGGSALADRLSEAYSRVVGGRALAVVAES
jgi:hypothetical protein